MSFNSSHKIIKIEKPRGKSVGRSRLADVYTNF
jgi:hypothetical protein